MGLAEQIAFITGPQLPIGTSYFDTTLVTKAKLHGESCPATPPTDDAGLNSFTLLQYYDLPLSLYTVYARTQDPAFLALANKCADAWWKHPSWIGEGRIRLWPDNASPPPRHAGIGGLILRALNGRPEMWDWINSYTNYFFYIYVKRRITQPIYDLREGAFVLRFATWLSQVLPDSFPLQAGGSGNGIALRAQYLADVEAATVQYFGRNQRADGAWVWNDEFRDSDGGTLTGVMQPFMVGLLLRSLCDAHQVVTNDLVRTSIALQILNGCRHLYLDGPYIKDQIEQNSGKKVRGFHYFYHGGTTVNPTKYTKGDIIFPWSALESWWVPSARQAISTILGSFGYAKKISGEQFYEDAGKEMYDSAYVGTDGLRAMMSDTAKNFNQHVYGSSSYMAWLAGTVTPLPTPAPQPTPPETPVVTITSPTEGAKLSGTITVTVTVTDAAKVDVVYLIIDGAVISSDSVVPYNLSLDTTKLLDGIHTLFVRAWNELGKATDSVKMTVTVANAVPQPVPQPTPVPTLPRTIPWPKQISKQNPIIETQRREGYYLKHIIEGISTKAEFEKVG